MARKHTEFMVHVIVWFVIASMPHMAMIFNAPFSWERVIFVSGNPVSLAIMFYVNYLWLIPKLLEKGDKKKFYIINAIILFTILVISHFWHTVIFKTIEMEQHPDGVKMKLARVPILFLWVRNLLIYCLIVLLAHIIRRSKRLNKAEQERETAELQSLRNQISPHFLLNTLNNIYALIMIRPEDAQKVVVQLSSLLRSLLYDNNAKTTLAKEAQFVGDYIELMRIRLSDNVKLQYEVDMPKDSNIEVAPHLAISLVENAFKHGISPTKPSEVYISLKYHAETHSTECFIRNTNYPKNKADKSGHGIGLDVLRQRLELSYPNRYKWTYGPTADNLYYESHLTIIL